MLANIRNISLKTKMALSAVLFCLVGLGIVGSSALAQQVETEADEDVDDEAVLYLDSLDCEACHENEAPTLAAENEIDDESDATDEVQDITNESDSASSKDVDEEEAVEDELSDADENEEDAEEVTTTLGDIHASLGCLTCHDDVETLASVHEDAGTRLPKRLRYTKVTEETCLSCHGSYEELAELTSDSTVLTDENGTVVNPHDLPENNDHATLTCTSCHQGHVESSVDEKAQQVCLGCHHMNVYECGTCHSF